MHVLVCDDDAATRFVIKRVLIHATGCQISECADGIEALHIVASTHIDLMVLDIGMPTLDGLAVLEELRSGGFKSLSVIILTMERREEVVRRLIELGILGYVLKPLSHERLLPLIDRARALAAALAKEPLPVDSIRLDPHNHTLLIDGSLEYRQLFLSHAERYGPVEVADSGLGGLAAFKLAPARLVFVGQDLGAIDADVVARKLRTVSAGAPLRLVAIRDAGADGEPPRGFDDIVQRVALPATHEELMRRFLPLSGALSGIAALVGDLKGLVSSTVIDVLGLALDSPIEEVPFAFYTWNWQTTVDIVVQQRFLLRVEMRASTSDARVIAARLLGLQLDAVEEGDLRASAAEVVGLFSGRLQAHLGGASDVRSSPRVEFHPPTLVGSNENSDLRFQFLLKDIGTNIVMFVRVETEGKGANPASANEPAARSASPQSVNNQ